MYLCVKLLPSNNSAKFVSVILFHFLIVVEKLTAALEKFESNQESQRNAFIDSIKAMMVFYGYVYVYFVHILHRICLTGRGKGVDDSR